MGFIVCSLFYVAVLLVIVKLYIKLTTGWTKSEVCLVGKTAIVTGGNNGIGYETAADLAKRGARVILACRNEDKAKRAVDKIIRETDNRNICYKMLDLSSFKSVKNFAEEINKTEPRLDILINNAGLYRVPENPGNTEDGLQQVMQANYFGHFLLTNLLLDLLKKTTPSRIVNVSSLTAKYCNSINLDELNESGPSEFIVYSKSKLCNVLFTIELNAKLKGTGVTTYSLHPGAISSEITKTLTGLTKIVTETIVKLFYKNLLEGAQTTIHCAISKEIEEYSGGHFHDCRYVKRYKSADNLNLPQLLWKRTEQLIKLEKFN